MNTAVIPIALLAAFPPMPALQWSAATVAATLSGATLVGGGVTLVAHSIWLFVELGQGTLAPWDPTRELVSAGAYGYIRNPMKTGLFLMLAGEALLARSLALGAWFALFVVVNVVYIRLHEERRLEMRFGFHYRDYCTRVPRWWPRLPSRRDRRTDVDAA